MSGFKVDIDLSEVVAGIKSGAEKGVRDAVEHLLTEANRSVPHDEGTLERSGQASVDDTRGAVSYDTPYAVRQHEDMTLHHDGKGRSKWLEVTFSQEAGTVARILVAAVKRGAGT